MEMRAWVEKATYTLNRGGIILYPTDTIWGIGCKATLPNPIKKIYRIKGRSDGKTMISLVESLERLETLMEKIPKITYQLVKEATTPLTIIYPNVEKLPPLLIAPDGSAAIRIVKHPLCEAIIRSIDAPLVSTSANLSGIPYAGSFESIPDKIKASVDLILPKVFDSNSHTKSSRIVKISPNDEQLTIIRE